MRLSNRADADRGLAAQPAHLAGGEPHQDRSQTCGGEVAACRSKALVRTTGTVGDPLQQALERGRDEEVEVRAGPVRLGGRLTVPQGAAGLVVFAHGSGSSRHSPRNRFVAAVLNEAGIGTLLLDLLTVDEELDRRNVFDIDLLAGRLLGATSWLRAQPGMAGLPIGYFGASTGAGAALVAAAEPEADLAAVVSRGGRPDLAASRLDEVSAPTLLVVGGDDEVVLELNRDAQDHLRCDNRLIVVPGATHLFEEPGTLRRAAEAARDWFTSHMATAPRSNLVAEKRTPGKELATKGDEPAEEGEEERPGRP